VQKSVKAVREDIILSILDTEAGVKQEKSVGVIGEKDECGDDVVGFARKRQTNVWYFVCEKGSKADGERDAWSRGK